MTKYARIRDGRLVDVYRVPQDYPDLPALERCVPGGAFTAVPDVDTNGEPLAHSAWDNGDGTYTNAAAPLVAKEPAILTDRQFRKFAAQKLGSAAAVGAVYSAARASNDPDVQFAFMAWTKAELYEKAEVAQLAAALVAGGCMTAQQRTALVGSWPDEQGALR